LAGDKILRLWDVARRVPVDELVGHTDGIETLAWSPDGQTLASGSWDHSLRVWDVRSGLEVQRLAGAHAAVFLAGGDTLAGAAEDGGVNFWDVATGRLQRRVETGPGSIADLALSHDGKTLAIAARRLHFWDAVSEKERLPPPQGPECGSMVVFSPEGTAVATPCGHSISFCDPLTGKLLDTDHCHTGALTSVGFCDDGRGIWTAGAEGLLRIWTKVGKPRDVREIPDAAHCFAISPGGRKLATTNAQSDGGLRLIDLTGDAAGASIPSQHLGVTAALAFAPDGNSIARAEAFVAVQENQANTVSFELALCQPLNARQFRSLGTHIGRVGQLAFSPDGKHLLVKTEQPDPALRVWEVATGRELRSPLPGIVTGEHFVLSPDASLLAMFGASHTEPWQPTTWPYERAALQVWEMATGRLVGSMEVASGRVPCAAFSGDGRLLAFGDGPLVCVWDVPAWAERALLRGHDGTVTTLTFAANNQTLVSGSADTTALIWDVSHLPEPRLVPCPLSEGQLLELWEDLASIDAARGWRAVGSLASSTVQAVPFLRHRLRPPPAVTTERMEKLIADLDSIQYTVREQSSEQLELLGERAETVLRTASVRSPSAEVRRRTALLLGALHGPGISADELRVGRALQVLRYIGTPEAIRPPLQVRPRVAAP
jgi:WD40 repeat protein